MPKLPRVSGAEAIRALQQLGFSQVRQRGSHVVLKRYWSGGSHRLCRSLTRGTCGRHIAQHLETSSGHR